MKGPITVHVTRSWGGEQFRVQVSRMVFDTTTHLVPVVLVAATLRLLGVVG